jgi:2-amino-4-hydroxy-6-hydroxymethyldihydropteridine diphosphokinase
MRTVYVAAGSNVEPEDNLTTALAALRRQFPDLHVSRAYANQAVGFEGPDFINLVVGFDTDLSLEQLLAVLHEVESACGRGRTAPKWAPRRMDLDLLLFGDVVGEFPGATLPRPDLLKRAFMLAPLAEIAPHVRHPVLNQSIASLWAGFDQTAHDLRPVAVPGAGPVESIAAH